MKSPICLEEKWPTSELSLANSQYPTTTWKANPKKKSNALRIWLTLKNKNDLRSKRTNLRKVQVWSRNCWKETGK